MLTGSNMPSAGTAEVRWTFTPTDKKYKPVNGTTDITVWRKPAPESAAAPTASELTYGQTLADSGADGRKSGETRIRRRKWKAPGAGQMTQ